MLISLPFPPCERIGKYLNNNSSEIFSSNKLQILDDSRLLLCEKTEFYKNNVYDLINKIVFEVFNTKLFKM